MRKRVVVNDVMQHGYVYYLTEPPGRHFAPEFKPELTPKLMPQLGVFGGKHMTDCQVEFPASWFTRAKLCTDFHNPRLNFTRDVAAIRKHCDGGDLECRRRPRQAVLHWAYDSRNI